jgi:hypothetical protein
MLEQQYLSKEDCQTLLKFLKNLKKFATEVLKDNDIPKTIKNEFAEFDAEIIDSYTEVVEFISKFDTEAIRELLEGFCLVFDIYKKFLIKYKLKFQKYGIDQHITEVEDSLHIVKKALSKEI